MQPLQGLNMHSWRLSGSWKLCGRFRYVSVCHVSVCHVSVTFPSVTFPLRFHQRFHYVSVSVSDDASDTTAFPSPFPLRSCFDVVHAIDARCKPQRQRESEKGEAPQKWFLGAGFLGAPPLSLIFRSGLEALQVWIECHNS